MKAKQARSQVALAYIRRADLILKEEYLNISKDAQDLKLYRSICLVGEHKAVVDHIIVKLTNDGYKVEKRINNSDYLKVSW